MQQITKILILLIVVAGVLYLAISFSSSYKKGSELGTGGVSDNSDRQYATFVGGDLSFEFKYPAGPEGYVLKKETSGAASSAIETLILFQAEDYKNLDNPPEGGEGPPVISIQVFENTPKQFPESWANQNPARSNINLKIGEISEVTIAGEKAIRYMADGLYASDNAVITHGDNVYVLAGQFFDADSKIRRDFETLLESIRFISKPDQQ